MRLTACNSSMVVYYVTGAGYLGGARDVEINFNSFDVLV